MSEELTALANTLIVTVSQPLCVQLTLHSDSVKSLDAYIEFAPPRQLNRSASSLMSEEFTALANTLIATVSQTLGVQLTFDSDSVKWLDGYIERVRSGMDKSQIHGLSNTVGAFLGECIIS